MKNQFLSRLLLVCAIAAVFLSLAGCYTLLKHPRISDEGRAADVEYTTPVTYADDCGACHESSSYVAAHGYRYGFASPHVSSYDRWYYYYEYPWWVRYYTPSVGDSAAGEQQRPFGRRHRGSQDNQPSQTAVSGSAPAANPSIISTSGSETGKNEPAPATKDERRDERRGGAEKKDTRRERKP